MARKLKRFVVGFDNDKQTIYGKDYSTGGVSEVRWADPMTLLQARRKLKELTGKVPKTIYKLVPVRGSE